MRCIDIFIVGVIAHVFGQNIEFESVHNKPALSSGESAG